MIWLAQVLCPDRHCILASAWDDAERSLRDGESRLIAAAEHLAARGGIERRCRWCGSESWHVAAERTPFGTMAAAAVGIFESTRPIDAQVFFVATGGPVR